MGETCKLKINKNHHTVGKKKKKKVTSYNLEEGTKEVNKEKNISGV